MTHEAKPLVRRETPADAAAIRRGLLAAFPTPAEAALVDELRAAGRLTVSRVAIDGGEVIGCVALSPVTIAGEPVGLGLAPVAVVPEWQGRGVGGRLVRGAIAAARERGEPLVVVLGDPGYYSRFGFTAASRYDLRDPYGGGDAFQALVLGEAKTTPRGLVAYASEFSRFG